VEVDYSPGARPAIALGDLIGQEHNEYTSSRIRGLPTRQHAVLLTQRFGFAGSPASIIKAVVWFAGTTPQPSPGPVAQTHPQPHSYQRFRDLPTVDGLALRQQPVISDANLIMRIPLSENILMMSLKIVTARRRLKSARQGQ